MSVVLAQSGGLAITHVTIVDPGDGKPALDMTILVRGHDIIAVGRAKQVAIPRSSNRCDFCAEARAAVMALKQ